VAKEEIMKKEQQIKELALECILDAMRISRPGKIAEIGPFIPMLCEVAEVSDQIRDLALRACKLNRSDA
jgi:hypothetical protein